MGERGSAPAEFVLVSALLVAVTLGMLQVMFVGYVRHTLTSAAAEGARQASLVDVSASQAVAATKALITESLSPRYAQGVAVARSQTLGVPTIEVIIRAPYPQLGLWSVGGTLEVRAHAPYEYVS